jgi:hypothetical protein
MGSDVLNQKVKKWLDEFIPIKKTSKNHATFATQVLLVHTRVHTFSTMRI